MVMLWSFKNLVKVYGLSMFDDALREMYLKEYVLIMFFIILFDKYEC